MSSCGFSRREKNARPAASPKSFGMTIAAAVRPRRTVARASSTVVVDTLKFRSFCRPDTIAFEMVDSS